MLSGANVFERSHHVASRQHKFHAGFIVLAVPTIAEDAIEYGYHSMLLARVKAAEPGATVQIPHCRRLESEPSQQKI